MERVKIPANQRHEAIKTYEGAFNLLTKDVNEYKVAFAEALQESKVPNGLDDQFYRDTAALGFIKCVRCFCDGLEETFANCKSIMDQVNEILEDADDTEEIEA